MDQDPLYMKNVVIPDFANNLQARIRLWEMKVGYRALAELWIDLARPLANPQERMNLGLQRAKELLQRKLLEEEEGAMGSLELQTLREYIPAQLWQWRNNTSYKEVGQRFHHHRWDYSVQREGEECHNKFEEDLQKKKREKLNLDIKHMPGMYKKRTSSLAMLNRMTKVILMRWILIRQSQNPQRMIFILLMRHFPMGGDGTNGCDDAVAD